MFVGYLFNICVEGTTSFLRRLGMSKPMYQCAPPVLKMTLPVIDSTAGKTVFQRCLSLDYGITV